MKVRDNKIIRTIFYPAIFLRRLYIKYNNRKIDHFNNLFSNAKEGSVIVSVKDIPGDFEIDIRSHILQRILINKKYEPLIVSSIKSNIDLNKDAINIGANIGLFTKLLSDLINNDRKVLAIEPTPKAFEYLNKNIIRNNIKEKVLLFNGICTNKSGEYIINSIVGKEEYSSIGESIHIAKLNTDIVKLKVIGDTIDNLIAKNNLHPGLVLIDVEGAEMKVLEGSGEMLIQYRPVIISELDDKLLLKQGTSSVKVIEFLNKNDYKVMNVIKHQKIKYPFRGNIIALPNI